ncbi:hypothetical protein LI328DRAFT_124925, partial [Trichoderma asperelloides]
FFFTSPGRLALATIDFAFARGSSCLEGQPARTVGQQADVLPSITSFTSDRRPPATHFASNLTQTPGQDVSPGRFLTFATAQVFQSRTPA